LDVQVEGNKCKASDLDNKEQQKESDVPQALLDQVDDFP
jgi:hypothetical protein